MIRFVPKEWRWQVRAWSCTESVRWARLRRGKVYAPGESDSNRWSLVGEPSLELHNDDLPTHLTTCSTLVNRIPDVIAAEPGYRTLDLLQPPR